MKVVLASNNQKKLRELQDILPPTLELMAAAQFNIESPEETGTTFVENAIIKARHACQVTGFAAIADDSGLEVDYLKAAPGIYSSRYAGLTATDSDNNKKLLLALDNVADTNRTARFRCVIVLMRHELDPMPLIAQGTWEGRILHEPLGENGFGYDPLFFVPSLNCSSAQLSAEQKNSLSHRGLAITQLKELLGSL